MTPIYKDSFGNQWYEFSNKMNIPAKRAIAAETMTRFADMNITKEKLRQLFGKMKEYANNGNIVDLFSLISEVEFRLDFIGEEETLLEFAVNYFILEGEPADKLSDSWTEKKKEILRGDDDAKSFFLSRAYLIITNYSELSGVDLEKYLKETQEHAKRLNRFLLGR